MLKYILNIGISILTNMTKTICLHKQEKEDLVDTERTIDSYLDNAVNHDELNTFNRIGEILSYKNNGEMHPHEHSFVFLYIDRDLFKSYNSRKEWEKDKLAIRNPFTDLYGNNPVNIYDDTSFVKDTLDKSVNYEGIFVLDKTSNNIIHNGLIIPVDFGDLYPTFGVNDDIKLIEKTGYPKSNPPEIGTKSKAMLYFSVYHPDVSFMKFDGDCYIVKNGKVSYLHNGHDFNCSDLSSFLP